MTPSSLKPGDKVRVTRDESFHGFKAGAVVRVLKEHPEDDDAILATTRESDEEWWEGGVCAWVRHCELERVEDSPETESVETESVEAESVEAESVEVDPRDAEIEKLKADLEFARDSLLTREREYASFIDRLVEDAHEYANVYGLCERFDEFMREHNLPTRQRGYRVQVEVRNTGYIFVEASSEDEACAIADEYGKGWAELTSGRIEWDDTVDSFESMGADAE